MSDAQRYQWLRQYLSIATPDGMGGWTCWLTLAEIPYRLDPSVSDPEVLLDALMERFPLSRPAVSTSS